MKIPKEQLSTSSAVLLGSVMISLSILLSGGIIKISGLSVKTSPGTPVITSSPSPIVAPGGANPQDPVGPVDISVDDDPVLGEKSAPVTMIEFSDYECPFCKRHFTEVYPQLKKDYIDTGKVKLVYRDFPLSFHNPLATTEAIAANCSRDQGGDSTYFKFHDAIFTKTVSNGNGLAISDLEKIASELGLNTTNFKSCLDSQKYKDEVAKDVADGSKVSVTGTPTFFIGKSSSSGVISGTFIYGAQPLASFKAEIEKLL